MSGNLQNKQEISLMELLRKILKIFHPLPVVNLLDQYLAKSLGVLEVKILLNLDMATKNNLEQVALMIHIQKL
jgi:hypothetical protein